MVTLAQGRAIACSFAFGVSAIAFQSISADVNFLQTVTKPAAANTVAAPMVVDTAMASATVDTSDTAPTPAPVQSMVLALADTGVSDVPARAPVARGLPPASRSADPAPARFFTINEVLAKRRQNPTGSPSVQLAAVDPKGRISDAEQLTIPAVHGEEPFGLFTFKAPDGMLWSKWRKVEAEVQAVAPVLARCRTDARNCAPGAVRFAGLIKQAEASQGRARLEFVNAKVNDAIRYTPDSVQWGVADRWSAPVDANHEGSFDTGLGDCEDYAIAKYVALREAGVAAQDLRVLLARDKVVRMDHAVLAVRSEGRWLYLDNRFPGLLEENDARFLQPLFALGAEGVKLFAAPYASNSTVNPAGTDLDDVTQSITAGTRTRVRVAPPSGLTGMGPLPVLM